MRVPEVLSVLDMIIIYLLSCGNFPYNLFIIQVITAYDYFVITHINKFIDAITQKCEIYFNKLPGNNANPTQTR